MRKAPRGLWLGLLLGVQSPWAPDARVVISDFSTVDAVAATPWLVFAATRRGLLIYDRSTRSWRPPVTAVDGYPAGRVRGALADPGGNAVWLGLVTGGYARYDPDGRLWSTGTPPSEAAASALTVEGALARAPAADALRGLMLTDPRLRTYRFTCAAATPDRPELFFGTNGMGVVRVDAQTAEWEALPFGLVAPGVGALAATGDGVWAAANARPGERRGLTLVSADLTSTRGAEGGGAALGFTFVAARRLLAAGGALWLATEQGVLRIDPGTMRSRLFDVPQATSLAPAPDGMWVGSTRELVVVTRDGALVRVATDLAVLSLVAARETLWAGTGTGLLMIPPGNVISRVDATAQPVYALARARDTIVAATERSLVWRDPAGLWKELPLTLALGRPTALAPDPDGGVWVGGTLGLAYAGLGRPQLRVLTVPFDVPGPVRDVAVDGDWLWVATDSGLVRFDRAAARNR